MRPDAIVIDAPALDDGAGLGQGGENLLVQAFITEPAVEAFDEAVLLRLARRDVVPGHAGVIGPLEDRPAGHLAAPTFGMSTMHRMRKRRPHDRLSAIKSRLQRWLGPSGRAMGAQVPVAQPAGALLGEAALRH